MKKRKVIRIIWIVLSIIVSLSMIALSITPLFMS